jgi:hypothetical protein
MNNMMLMPTKAVPLLDVCAGRGREGTACCELCIFGTVKLSSIVAAAACQALGPHATEPADWSSAAMIAVVGTPYYAAFESLRVGLLYSCPLLRDEYEIDR